MLLLCDLRDHLPLSEPQMSHVIQRSLVFGDSETRPAFALDSTVAKGPSSLKEVLRSYVNKAVQLATKSFLHYPCLGIPALFKTFDGL